MVCVYQLRTRSCLVAYLLYVLQERVPSRRSVVILVCVSTCSFARQHRREYNATSGASRRTEHALRHVNTASSIESKVNNRADANSPQHDLQLLHTHRERFLCCKAPARAPCAFASQPVHHHALLRRPRLHHSSRTCTCVRPHGSPKLLHRLGPQTLVTVC